MVTRRCSECRASFHPSPQAQATQRVCSPKCRVTRDRKLARKRRRRDLDDFRTEERERQRSCRRRRAEAREAPEGGGCHAPPAAPNSLELPDNFIQFVDRAVERSRASLLRDLRQVWPPSCPILATSPGQWQVSRASFRVETTEIQARDSSRSGSCHATGSPREGRQCSSPPRADHKSP